MNKKSAIGIIIAVLVVVIATLAFISRTKVPAGYVGVKFNLYGDDKGVSGEVVGPGKYWLTWNEELYLFPTFAQTDTWARTSTADESITFQDREGTQINADIGITYSVRADKADTVFQKYRKGIDEISDIYLRNMVRDAVVNISSKMDVADINGPGKEQMMKEVTSEVQSQVSNIGINIEKIYWISSLRLPDNIRDAINKKIEATQKAQQRENELQETQAQAEKDRESARGKADARKIEALGEAEANARIQASLTPNLIEYMKIKAWNGELPQVVGSSTPIIDLRSTQH